ncbi:ABC transporter ATP-binding protein [Thermoflavifilum thermophilum]|uniref:Lipoprotein-releasing system ATP-binding protein n=2 Tax=Thermoflavifilum thermophilum TaxID=1393122 RepID=A0A1I7NG23_9BACT|nr:ABC transporter ATP-binding protein [Thermoflavifilum thermophilum]SFV33506.1 lipoprotein-releasing system ATP-binding protein [Thermoflavifilum thermophilum]
MMMLKAENLHKSYGSLHVLKGISLTVQRGEIVSILGSSGAGKSTLLHILGTLDSPSSGRVWLHGQDVFQLSSSALAAFRNRHIGFVFQFHYLLPEFTALENVCMPGWIAGEKKSVVEERARMLLETMGLRDRLHHKPAMLSGGEQQRVAVARALINHPDIVFADEPTGNLDSAHALELHQLFQELQKQFNQTFVIVTHNEALARLSDRQLLIKDGQLLQHHDQHLMT